MLFYSLVDDCAAPEGMLCLMHPPVPHIFIVDDDERILTALGLLVTSVLQFSVSSFLPQKLKDMLRLAVAQKPALIVLDHHLSASLKGTEVLTQLRELGVRSPVIFLSGEEDADIKVDALNLTADDFISKPFNALEMVARIKCVLRRSARVEDARVRGNVMVTDDDFICGGCTFSPRAMTATGLGTGKAISVTPYILAVAQLLYEHRESVLTRREIINLIWGSDVSEKSRTLDQTIYDLKRRIHLAGGDGGGVLNVKGVGYRYTEALSAAA